MHLLQNILLLKLFPFLYSRDITSDSMFYIYCKREGKAIEMFLMKDSPWISMSICIFEPDYKFAFAGVLCLSTEHPLLPLLSNMDIGAGLLPYVSEWATSTDLHVLFVCNADTTIQRASLVEGCGANMCDAQHQPKERCCALSAGVPPKQVLRCVISSKAGGISKSKFQLASWTSYFVSNDAMKVGYIYLQSLSAFFIIIYCILTRNI